MGKKVDINCDLGESYGAYRIGDDERIMPYITSANIACGFHAGEPAIMAQTVNLAKKNKVAVGAHPGFPDLMGFGRREIKLSSEEARSYVIYQIGALQAFCRASRVGLQHVKPHGAFYNMAAKEEPLAKALTDAARAFDPSLIVFAPPNSELAKAATKARLKVANEFFADRAYNPDGSLVPRREDAAMLQEPRKVIERSIMAVTDGRVITPDGKSIEIGEPHTICIHGDTPSAVKLAQALKKEFSKANIKTAPVGSFL